MADAQTHRQKGDLITKMKRGTQTDGQTQTDIQQSDLINILSCFQNKESMLEMKGCLRENLTVCVSVCLCPTLLGKHVAAGKNTHPTTEVLLGAVFSMRCVSYQILNM
jgi:hypothetical protein